MTHLLMDMYCVFKGYRACAGGDWEEACVLARQCIERADSENVFTTIAHAILVSGGLKSGGRPTATQQIRRIAAYCETNHVLIPFTGTRLFHPLLHAFDQAGLVPAFTALVRERMPQDEKRLQVRCFGDFAVLPSEGAVPLKWRTHKAQELFAFLIHNRGAGVRKTRILSMFWPDMPPERATDLLHTTLYGIRKIMPEACRDIVVYRNQEYFIDPERVSTGLDEFERLTAEMRAGGASSAGTLSDFTALDRFIGTYMGGIDGDWVLNSRERFQLLQVRLLRRAAEQAMAARCWEEAIALWQRAIGVEPYDEALHVALMRCYHDMGQPSRIHVQYRHLAELLKKDLDAAPSEETIAAHRHLTGAREA